MLSQKIIRARQIYAVCESSKEIKPGDVFKDVKFIDQNEEILPGQCRIICCGEISKDEMLFRSSDGRFYFSIKDGWGAESDILYGITKGLYFDFQHPTTDQTILSECESHLGTYKSWAGAMAFQARKHTLEKISEVMKRVLR